MERDGAIHVKKSDPDFQRLFDLANDLAIAKNPGRWFNMAAPDRADYMTEVERLKRVDEIYADLCVALAEASVPQVFRDYIYEHIDLSWFDRHKD